MGMAHLSVKCTHTTQATQLDNGPIHTSHPMLAGGVIVPVPHGSAEAVLYLYHTGHPTPVGGVIVPVPYSSPEVVLYPYCMGQPTLYCTHSTWVGRCMPALTIYITCLFW
jgi:hypothetical protein